MSTTVPPLEHYFHRLDVPRRLMFCGTCFKNCCLRVLKGTTNSRHGGVQSAACPSERAPNSPPKTHGETLFVHLYLNVVKDLRQQPAPHPLPTASAFGSGTPFHQRRLPLEMLTESPFHSCTRMGGYLWGESQCRSSYVQDT